MSAQIRPNRLEVTDRFPMLGFTIRTDGAPQRAEIAVATDPALFLVENRGKRSTSNFYSSRAGGPLPIPRGEGVWVVPAEVLARFVGSERLYAALATAPERNGTGPRVDVLPGPGAPYVSLRGLTGRSLRRMRPLPSRPHTAATYAARDKASLDWAGDAQVATVAPPRRGQGSNGSAVAGDPVADYDDGFGPLQPLAPPPTKAPSQPSGAQAPTAPAQGHALRAAAFSSEIPLDPGNGGMSIGLDALAVGDLIVSTTAAAVSRGIRFATGSDVSHAMLYVGQGGQVIDATGPGVQLRLLADAISDATLAVAFRYPGLSGEQQQVIADKAAEYIGLPYNYWGIVRQARFQVHSTVCDVLPASQAAACKRFMGQIDLGRGNQSEFLCSELVVAAYQAAGVPITSTPPIWTNPEDLVQLALSHGALAYVGHLKAPPYGARTSVWDSLGFSAPQTRRSIVPAGSPTTRASSHGVVRGLSAPSRPVRFPSTRVLTGVERQVALAALSALPGALASARGLTSARGVSLAIGPSISAGLIEGLSVGAGVIFAPGDVVGLYGQIELRAGVLDSLSAELQCTVVQGGIEAFGGINFAVGAEIDMGGSVSVQVLFDSNMQFQGVTFGFGAGAALEPLQVFASVQAEFGAAFARSHRAAASSRALGIEPFTINWDEVPLVAKSPTQSCWATAATMVIAWRDGVGLGPDTVATIAGRTTVADDLARVSQFASEIGLVAEPVGPYSPVGVRDVLERRGPVWVATPTPRSRAVVVTGAYADANGYFVRVTDPLDREVTTVGASGGHTGGSSTGSRYILGWEDFAREFGTPTSNGEVTLALLHGGGTGGRVPNRGPATGAGYAQAARSAALGEESFTLNWDEVEAIPQPTDFSCWASAGAMLVGWRDRVSLAPESVANICSRTTATGLDPQQVGQFATELGLVAEPPLCYSVDGFRALLESSGPLWVASAVPGLHAIVVTGLYGEGDSVFVRVTDPWDRGVGTPGAPGKYLSTHVTGSRYIMKWDDFVREYESAAVNFPGVNLQVLHSGGTGGRTPNYGSATSAGYAQALRAVRDASRRGSAFSQPGPADTAAAPATAVAPSGRRQEAGASDGAQWLLDQYDGMRAPTVPSSGVTAAGERTVRLDDWPLVALKDGRVQLPVSVSWRFDKGATGDVRVTPEVLHTVDGWALSVGATITEGPDAPDVAALSVRVRHVFVHDTDLPIVGITEVCLFGDGTYQRRDRWEQAAA